MTLDEQNYPPEKHDPALNVTEGQRRLGGVTGKGFMPGRSGNPKGLNGRQRPRRPGAGEHRRRPTPSPADVPDRPSGKLKSAGRNGKVLEVRERPSISERIEATKWLSDRGWGKARDIVEVEGEARRPFMIVLPGHGKDPWTSLSRWLRPSGSCRRCRRRCRGRFSLDLRVLRISRSDAAPTWEVSWLTSKSLSTATAPTAPCAASPAVARAPGASGPISTHGAPRKHKDPAIVDTPGVPTWHHARITTRRKGGMMRDLEAEQNTGTIADLVSLDCTDVMPTALTTRL